MFSSSLIEILKAFTKEDLKKFEEFILSPYFNKKSPSVKLFRIIKKYAPDFKDERLKREEFEWTRKFLEKYKSKLSEDFREQTFLFTSAFLEFGRKDFIRSLEILSKLKHHEVRDKPREKMLYIMLYYELGYQEQLLSAIDSAKHFAKNDKQLSKEYKKKFTGFINCVYNIAKIKFKLSGSDEGLALQQIKNEMKENNVSQKNWLEGKLNEL